MPFLLRLTESSLTLRFCPFVLRYATRSCAFVLPSRVVKRQRSLNKFVQDVSPFDRTWRFVITCLRSSCWESPSIKLKMLANISGGRFSNGKTLAIAIAHCWKHKRSNKEMRNTHRDERQAGQEGNLVFRNGIFLSTGWAFYTTKAEFRVKPTVHR